MLIGKKRSSGPKSFQNGRYLVQSLLGEGSTGLVYEVLDQELDGERIALKLFHPQLLEDEATYERFRKQILLIRQLSHPNIVQVYDFDRDERGNYILTMELVSGMDLNTYLRENPPFPFSDALVLLTEIAKGLAYAHSAGITHRELTPANVLLSSHGQVKISDFGVARCFEDSLGLTATGELLANPAFSSPEKLKGQLLDNRSDVYSFGVLAYQVVTGKLPFEGRDFFSQAEAQITQALPDMHTSNNETLPLWFHDMVSKCCEKEPRKRYESAVDLSRRLDEHIRSSESELPQAFDITFIQRVRKAKKLRSKPMVVFPLIIAFLIIAYVVSIQSNTRRFIGVWTLLAEKKLGFELPYIKNPFWVRSSLLRPQDFLVSLSQPNSGNIDFYAYIVAGGDLTVRDSAGNGIGHVALLNNEVEVLQTLHRYGYDMNSKNNRGETLLLRALRLHLPSTAAYLPSLGANVNFCDRTSVCPIHLAVQSGYKEVIDTIGFWGGSIVAPDANGLNVIHLLARDQDLEKLSYLSEKFSARKWQFDTRDPEGKTPLMYAVMKATEKDRMASLISILINSGGRIESRDDLGRTSLMHALLKQNSVAVEELLLFGADSHSSDAKGKTVASYAEDAGLSGLLK